MASKKCIIVGGSLGGLFSGIVLKRLGHAVTIFERSPSSLLQDQGAGIVAGSEILAFLRQHDRTNHPIAVKSSLRQYLDQKGNQIHAENSEQHMTSWDLIYHILRANFDGLESKYTSVPEQSNDEGMASYEVDRMVTDITLNHDQKCEISYKTQAGDKSTLLADLVIGADGPSSTVRSLFSPSVKRNYAGYVAWRGTVPESSLSSSAASTFIEKFTFFHAPGTQILAYMIPGRDGALKPGERLLNWVWYCNYTDGTADLDEVMTDADGTRRHISVPSGKVRDKVWEAQLSRAESTLPPQFVEVIKGTNAPFIQAITDVISEEIRFLDGKVVLVGDAVAGFRPHTASSTNQAALHARALDRVLRGETSWEQWGKEVTEYAKHTQKAGVEMGERSQFGEHPLRGDERE